MRALSPDGYVREYLAARKRGARGTNFVDSTGRKYLKRCRKCKHRHRHWSNKEKAWVCGHCGEAWGYYFRYVMKGHVQVTPNVDVADFKAAGIATIGLLLDRWLGDPTLPPWQSRLYVYMIGMGSSASEMARSVKPPELVSCPYPWSRWCLTNVIREARGEWTRRLCQAGLSVE